jgi:hypothetical protein
MTGCRCVNLIEHGKVIIRATPCSPLCRWIQRPSKWASTAWPRPTSSSLTMQLITRLRMTASRWVYLF